MSSLTVNNLMERRFFHLNRRRAPRPSVLRLRNRGWVVLMLFMIGNGAASCQRSRTLMEAQGLTPSQVVELYVRWVQAGQAEKAYALRTAEIQRQLDFDSFKSFVERGRQENSMGWEVTITMKPRRETMVSSTVANVELEYQRQGQTRVMTITCHKEDGIWKLGAFG